MEVLFDESRIPQTSDEGSIVFMRADGIIGSNSYSNHLSIIDKTNRRDLPLMTTDHFLDRRKPPFYRSPAIRATILPQSSSLTSPHDPSPPATPSSYQRHPSVRSTTLTECTFQELTALVLHSRSGRKGARMSASSERSRPKLATRPSFTLSEPGLIDALAAMRRVDEVER